MSLNKILIILVLFLVTACGVKSPVLYPNAKYNKIGKSKSEQMADDCEKKAEAAGIEKDKSTKKALRSGGVGALAGGAAGAAGSAIYGGNVGRATAAGAAGGGIWGFFTRMFSSDEPNPVYKSYVNRCIKGKGLEVIGWD